MATPDNQTIQSEVLEAPGPFLERVLTLQRTLRVGKPNENKVGNRTWYSRDAEDILRACHKAANLGIIIVQTAETVVVPTPAIDWTGIIAQRDREGLLPVGELPFIGKEVRKYNLPTPPPAHREKVKVTTRLIDGFAPADFELSELSNCCEVSIEWDDSTTPDSQSDVAAVSYARRIGLEMILGITDDERPAPAGQRRSYSVQTPIEEEFSRAKHGDPLFIRSPMKIHNGKTLGELDAAELAKLIDVGSKGGYTGRWKIAVGAATEIMQSKKGKS